MNNDHDICWISVDIEASGAIPPTFNMLSLGACLVDDERVTFKCLFKPISSGVSPEAMKVSRLSLTELSETGKSPESAMREFADWIKAQAGTRTPVFVGLNAAFDWAFVNYYFLTYFGSNPFGFAPLDIKAFYAGRMGVPWLEARSSKMSARLKAKHKPTHDALDDAVAQAELFRLVREISQNRL